MKTGKGFAVTLKIFSAPLLVSILVFFGQVMTHAQTPEQPPACVLCPSISVSCPTDILRPGERATVSSSVAGGDPNAKFTNEWEVSAGKIVSGQGTSQIAIDIGGEVTTATLKVSGGGIPEECSRSASCTFSVSHVGNTDEPDLHPFDSFGTITLESEQARLDTFAVELSNNQDVYGYVIVYRKRGTNTAENSKAIRRMRAYLTRKRGINLSRFDVIDGGIRSIYYVQIWTIPVSIQPPAPQPEL